MKVIKHFETSYCDVHERVFAQNISSKSSVDCLYQSQLERIPNNGEELQTLTLWCVISKKILLLEGQLKRACSLYALKLDFSEGIWEINYEAFFDLIHSSRRSLVSISLGFYCLYKFFDSQMFERILDQFSESSRDMIALKHFSILIEYKRQSISQLLLKSIGTNIQQLETLQIFSKNKCDEFPSICQILKNNKLTLREFSFNINYYWTQNQNVTQFFEALQDLDSLEKLELIFQGFKTDNLKSLPSEGWSMISNLKALKTLSLKFQKNESLQICWKALFNGLKSIQPLEELCFSLQSIRLGPVRKIAKIISRQQNSLRKLTLTLRHSMTYKQFSEIGKEIKKLSCLESLTLVYDDLTYQNNKLFDFLVDLSDLKFLSISVFGEGYHTGLSKYLPVIFDNKLKLNHLILNFNTVIIKKYELPDFDINEKTMNSLRESLLKCKGLISLQLDEILRKLSHDGLKFSIFKRQLPHLVLIKEID